MDPRPDGLRTLGPILCGLLVLAHASPWLDATPPAWIERAALRGRAELDPARMAVRDLRRLPGVGERRAERIVEARRRARAAGELLRWSDIEGIGPKTTARIRAWLSAHGAREDAPLTGRPPIGEERWSMEVRSPSGLLVVSGDEPLQE